MFVQTTTEAITPTDKDSQLARASSEALAPLLSEKGSSRAHIHFSTESDHEADITLPLPAVHLLFQALQEMAKGNTVTLLPVDTELTTQQAAELMRVSRPSLIKMLEDKKLPYRTIGTHRRVRYEDIMLYLKAERARRAEVVRELMAETERLGLY